MKYNSLKSQTVKVFDLPICKRGIDFTGFVQNTNDEYLSNGKNIWFNKGKITNRPGLKIDSENIITSNIINEALRCDYELTDTTFYHENKLYKIAFSNVDYDSSSYFISVFLVSEEGTVKNLGYIHFGRTNDSTFYIPHKCLFYVGKPVNGGGIFALISLHNIYDDTQITEKIYEIDSNYAGWSLNFNYYIPTVFINGRGDSYGLAKEVGVNFSGEPTALQPLNVLCGSFYAYYTSDGYSSSFRLPFLNLADESVVCRIYYTMSEFAEWVVYAGQNSAESTLQGIALKMTIDRKKGIVNFTSKESNFAIPHMTKYGENNIRFLAKKEIENGFKEVVSADCCTVAGTRVLFSSGNKIYSASYENPLYFPQNFNNDVGSPDTSVTALTAVDDVVLAFKENSLYSIELTEGKPINKITLLADNDMIFNNADTYKIKCVTKTVGCANKKTAKSVNGNMIWQAKNGQIFLYKNNNVRRISEKIDSFFDSFKDNLGKAVSGGTEDFYILCMENKAVIMSYDQKLDSNNIAWYIWEFPQDINVKGVVTAQNSFLFLCSNNKSVGFIANLNSKKDSIVTGMRGNVAIETQNISANLKTKSFTLGNSGDKKRVSRVYLQLEAEGSAKISVGNDAVCSEFQLNTADCFFRNKCVKLITNLNNINDVSIELSTEHNFSLGKGEIYFSKIN